MLAYHLCQLRGWFPTGKFDKIKRGSEYEYLGSMFLAVPDCVDPVICLLYCKARSMVVIRQSWFCFGTLLKMSSRVRDAKQ